MKFEEFMKLEKGDGIIIDNYTGTITEIKNYLKGSNYSRDMMKVIITRNIRELEITFFNDNSNKVEKRFISIYTDFSNEVHNRCMLNRLRIWDPLQEWMEGGE